MFFRPTQANPSHAPPLRERLALLPGAVQVFLAVVLLAAFLPPAVELAALVAEASSPIAQVAAHPALLWAGSLLACALPLLCLERPRSRSARAYLAQLRSRFRAVQSHYDGELRRLP